MCVHQTHTRPQSLTAELRTLQYSVIYEMCTVSRTALLWQIHEPDNRLDQPCCLWTTSLKRKLTFMAFLLYWLVHDRLRLREMGWFKTDVAKFSVCGIRLSAAEQLGESLMSVQFLLRCQKNTLAHVNNKSCTICTRALVRSLNSQKSISPTVK